MSSEKVYYYVYCASKATLHKKYNLIEEINICAGYDKIALGNRIKIQIHGDYHSYGRNAIANIVENIKDPIIRLYWRNKIFK